jgi:hypothetical protein
VLSSLDEREMEVAELRVSLDIAREKRRRSERRCDSQQHNCAEHRDLIIPHTSYPIPHITTTKMRAIVSPVAPPPPPACQWQTQRGALARLTTNTPPPRAQPAVCVLRLQESLRQTPMPSIIEPEGGAAGREEEEERRALQEELAQLEAQLELEAGARARAEEVRINTRRRRRRRRSRRRRRRRGGGGLLAGWLAGRDLTAVPPPPPWFRWRLHDDDADDDWPCLSGCLPGSSQAQRQAEERSHRLIVDVKERVDRSISPVCLRG